ncbi:MAG: hypothetical protein KVP17_000527 [Porospora cf. gigantea B]|uniref:uncharacterized protein n=2 Tax=Porospora cf. gigantea B TaxID=2853592 RepID=UPI003571B600|nr:MAG: hypothetical protein KVP17_000527 [Porospora cf. gigantea B]
MKKDHANRLDETTLVQSDDDPELLLRIPFNTPVSLHSLVVIGGEGGTAPSCLRVFADRELLDLSTADDETPVQELDLATDFCGTLEYPLKVTRLRNVQLLHLHIPTNFGAPTTQVYYIGLKGERTGYRRAPVNTVYESRANLNDHKVKDDITPGFGI